MRIEQIEIKGGAPEGVILASTLAIVDDIFAIHPSQFGAIEFDAWGEEPTIAFTLTHRPTGYAVITGRSWVEVLGFWNEIHARPEVDWNMSDPERVVKELSPEFGRIRKAVEARVLAARKEPVSADAVDPVAANQD